MTCLRSNTTLSYREAAQVMERALNYPLFVPNLGVRATQLLVSGDVRGFVEELTSLSQRGYLNASVLLAYLHLKGAIDGSPNYQRAEDLCGFAAESGNAYAQYVMGWICRLTDREMEAFEWLRKSASKGLFSPAMVDLGRFVTGGVGLAQPDPRVGLRILWDAHKFVASNGARVCGEIIDAGVSGKRWKDDRADALAISTHPSSNLCQVFASRRAGVRHFGRCTETAVQAVSVTRRGQIGAVAPVPGLTYQPYADLSSYLVYGQ